MKLFHATTVHGLKYLNPNSRDRDGNSVLYLTDNFPYSLFYIRDREIDFVTCGVREGGVVFYDEKFPNQLEVLYKGMSGWVYEVEAETEPTKIRGIYAVRGNAAVTGVTYIPDALQAIQREIEKGSVYFLAYEALSDRQKAMNHEGLVQLFRSGSVVSSRKEAFLREHFPEAWEEAENVLA